MINYDLLIPGSKVEIKTEGMDGFQLCEIADPPHSPHKNDIRVIAKRGALSRWRINRCDIKEIRLAESKPTDSCSCSISILMIGGCKCGFLQREREAAR